MSEFNSPEGRRESSGFDRITESSFEDTNKLFVRPERVDLRITPEGTAEYWVEQIVRQLRSIFATRLWEMTDIVDLIEAFEKPQKRAA